MITSIVIRKTLYKIDSGPFKKILHLFDFIGVFVHEASHAIACVFMHVPIKEFHLGWREEITNNVGPHGYIATGLKERTFMKSVVISLAPLLVSTWLFIFSLDSAFNESLPDLLRLICGFLCFSLILGASPSSQDFNNIGFYFNKDIQYSFYQIFLLCLSFITIMIIVIIFDIVFFEPIYLFLIGFGYYFYKYAFLGIKELGRKRYLRLEPRFSMKTHMRPTHNPLKSIQLGFEEAHW